MELKFKKYTIISEKRQFTLIRNGKKEEKWNYSDIRSALNAIPTKSLLKEEFHTRKEILAELEEIKEWIKNLKIPEN